MTDEFLGLRKVAKQADALGLRVPLTAQLALALFDRVEKAERERDEYRDGTTIVKLTEAEQAIARVRELYPGADDPCAPKTCTHTDCEIINALEGDK